MWLSDFVKREWHEVRAHFKYEVYRWVVLGAGGLVIAAGAYLIHKFPGPDWVLPACIFVLAVAVLWWLGSRIGKSPDRTPPQSTNQSASSTLVPPAPNFDATAFFRTAYISPLTAEAEKNGKRHLMAVWTN
jgi:hypothetical protein